MLSRVWKLFSFFRWTWLGILCKERKYCSVIWGINFGWTGIWNWPYWIVCSEFITARKRIPIMGCWGTRRFFIATKSWILFIGIIFFSLSLTKQIVRPFRQKFLYWKNRCKTVTYCPIFYCIHVCWWHQFVLPVSRFHSARWGYYRPVGTKLILGGCERSEPKWGSGSLPKENFSRPRRLDRWKTPLFYKLHYSNDEQLAIFRCLIDEEHHLQNLKNEIL